MHSDRGILKEIPHTAAVVVGASTVIVGDQSGSLLTIPSIPGPSEVANFVATAGILTLTQEPL
jgi:hypothetical protein